MIDDPKLTEHIKWGKQFFSKCQNDIEQNVKNYHEKDYILI